MNKTEDDEITDENLTDGEIKALAERKLFKVHHTWSTSFFFGKLSIDKEWGKEVGAK